MNALPKKNLMTMTSEVKWKCYRDSDQTRSTWFAPVVLRTSTYVCFVQLDEDFCLMAASPYGYFDLDFTE